SLGSSAVFPRRSRVSMPAGHSLGSSAVFPRRSRVLMPAGHSSGSFAVFPRRFRVSSTTIATSSLVESLHMTTLLAKARFPGTVNLADFLPSAQGASNPKRPHAREHPALRLRDLCARSDSLDRIVVLVGRGVRTFTRTATGPLIRRSGGPGGLKPPV